LFFNDARAKIGIFEMKNKNEVVIEKYANSIMEQAVKFIKQVRLINYALSG